MSAPFQWNPFTSFLDRVGQGGGSGDVQTLTPNQGGAVSAVGGTIQVVGQYADTVPTVDTYNSSAGVLSVADQTWFTQYVVDPSTEPGLKGTFQTIQSAIDQAVIDGMSATNKKQIYIRNATYTENLTIADGVQLKGAFTLGSAANTASVSITGHHTISASSQINLSNLYFTNSHATLPTFSTSSSSNRVSCQECLFEVTASANHFTANNVSFQANNCSFIGGSYESRFSFDSATVFFLNSELNTNGITCGNNVLLKINDCEDVGPTSITTGSSVQVYDTNFIANTTSMLTGTTGNASILEDVSFSSSSTTSPAIAIVGEVYISNVGGNNSDTPPLYGSATSIFCPPCTQGSVIFRTASAASLSVTKFMHYIGITSTASARTVTLPISGLTPGKSFIIKDESGAAATNNITVTCSGGATNIDGAVTYPINANYGSITVIWSGTQYFIL